MSDRLLAPDKWPPGNEGDKVAGEIIKMLARRDLYKRALVISRLFVPDIDSNDHAKSGFERLLACGTNETDHETLRQQIFQKTQAIMGTKPYKENAKELLRTFKIHHLLLDIPRSPTVEETHAVMVPVSSGANRRDTKFVPLSDIFPIEKWVDAYNAIKWRGHVFSIDEAVPFVNAGAREVLSKAPYHLNFSDEATQLCKIPNPISLAATLF